MMRLSWLMIGFPSAVLLGVAPAHAQFVGDVYFAQPSIAVPAGSAGDLDLTIFTGDKPFGATIATVTFDPAKLSVDTVTAGVNGGNSVRLQSVLSGGTVRIIAVNASSLTQPIGSVVIARLHVRPIGSPNDRIILHSAVTKALFADRSAISAGTGYDAEVTIGQAQSSSTTSLYRVAETSALAERAKRLRPAGSEVRLIVRMNGGGIGEVRVRAVGSSAASE